jgi:two-component system sensor histidine kinase BaeS
LENNLLGVNPVFKDVQQLGRVLSNLASNTPCGRQVNICASRKEDSVRLEVRDSREGIPHNDLPYIFDRFYRGKKSCIHATNSFGLGLAIASAIVEPHGETISVESPPDRETRIYFYLPDAI